MGSATGSSPDGVSKPGHSQSVRRTLGRSRTGCDLAKSRTISLLRVTAFCSRVGATNPQVRSRVRYLPVNRHGRSWLQTSRPTTTVREKRFDKNTPLAGSFVEDANLADRHWESAQIGDSDAELEPGIGSTDRNGMRREDLQLQSRPVQGMPCVYEAKHGT